MSTSIDLSAHDDLRPLSRILRTLSGNARGVADGMLVIGATARDLLLRHAYDLPVTRLTNDIDVAVAVQSWSAFASFRARLVEMGASPDASRQHRFHLHGWQIDVVPFGGIDVNGTIAWPPDQSTEMTVLGFAEAARHATRTVLPDRVVVPVASLPAQFLLKIIAWSERHRTLDDRDARDRRTLIAAYAGAWNEGRLYDEAGDLLARFGYDNELAAAALLGRDAAAIAERLTAERAEHPAGRDLTRRAPLSGRHARAPRTEPVAPPRVAGRLSRLITGRTCTPPGAP